MKASSSKFVILFVLCSLFVVSVVVEDCKAQDYFHEHTAPIAHHARKVSGVTFPSGKENTEQHPVGILFSPRSVTEYADIDEQAIRYDMPKVCTKSESILEEVFHHTEGTDSLDIVVYDASKSFKNRGSFKGPQIPWDPMYDIQAGYESVDARFQDLIRSLNPKCLPARFRFVYVDNQRFQEIRYGDKIWGD